MTLHEFVARTGLQTIVLEQVGDAVLIVRLNRPSIANAISTEMGHELIALFGALEAEPSLARCVILTGAGDRAFCGGADLKQRSGMTNLDYSRQHYLFERMVRAVTFCPVPLICAANGSAVAGGLELLLACDFAYASSSALFGFTEVRRGIMPGGGGTQQLPRAVGIRRAKELIFRGGRFSAQEALDWGLVNRLCAPGRVLAEAIEAAEDIGRSAPLAVVQAKKAIDLGMQMDLRSGLYTEIEAYGRLIPTDDRREGIDAYNQGRELSSGANDAWLVSQRSSDDPRAEAVERVSTAATQERVTVREVGPRDGLQMARSIMPTAAKIRWTAMLSEAGLTEIEVGSFVPPKLVPQMADTEAVVRGAREIPGIVVNVLVPNLKGAQLAHAAGAHRIVVPISVSESHSRANTRRGTMESVGELERIASWASGAAPELQIEVGCATAFGCSIEGAVPEERVLMVVRAVVAAGARCVSLADTVGYANPFQVKRLVAATREAIGPRLRGLHLHDTLGLGLANAAAGVEAGIRHFDASLGGLGGCPFAPGASGNIVTEDLVFMLESMGFATGIDLVKLVAARSYLVGALPDEPLHGALATAGIPKTFVGATSREGQAHA